MKFSNRDLNFYKLENLSASGALVSLELKISASIREKRYIDTIVSGLYLYSKILMTFDQDLKIYKMLDLSTQPGLGLDLLKLNKVTNFKENKRVHSAQPIKIIFDDVRGLMLTIAKYSELILWEKSTGF